ncbi:MAG: ferric reductase [Frankiales bacterium]|nr:ferric reductase [Frankiales bacterium]
MRSGCGVRKVSTRDNGEDLPPPAGLTAIPQPGHSSLWGSASDSVCVTVLAEPPTALAPDASAAAPARSQARPGLVLGLIALGAVGCIGLWWQNTPSVSGLGDWLTNAGRITGLLAGYAMVVLVALMARMPPLERGIGADRLARWHAMGGRYAVSLVVAHGLLITWGYAVAAHTNPVAEGKTLLLSYPDVLMGTVAGLLLVGVGITSARAARRRMRYETWFYLHLYTYLAIALAFSHQFATGAEFMSNPTARWAWSLLYAAVGGAILWYRFATPVRQARRHQLRVDRVVRESADTVSVVLHGLHLDELHAEAGQFFRFRFLTKDLWWVSSPYSLSAPVHPDKLRITVKDLGSHSRALAALTPGTRVVTEGPYGAMTAARRTRRKVLLVAGGVGITPLRAMFQTLPADPGELTLVYRASSADDVVFRAELEALAAQRGARLHLVTGTRAELGGDPLSTEVLTRNVPDLAGHDVFVCGPDGMTEAVVSSLRAAGIPRQRIHHESFTF